MREHCQLPSAPALLGKPTAKAACETRGAASVPLLRAALRGVTIDPARKAAPRSACNQLDWAVIEWLCAKAGDHSECCAARVTRRGRGSAACAGGLALEVRLAGIVSDAEG